MTIFVHRASECLTDHHAHGDGLICHALLRGLADRGHRIFAFTDHDGVTNRTANLTVRAAKYRSPADALGPWELALRADRWLKKLARQQPIDFVWRMHPYGAACPLVPFTGGRPLVVGPLFYEWPIDPTTTTGRPRLGVGIAPLVLPAARRGWQRTLRAARLVLCATDRHADQIRRQTDGDVRTLPVIVDPPSVPPRGPAGPRVVRLTLVANLVPNKRVEVFCDVIRLLRVRGLDARGTIVGDGPDREQLGRLCVDAGTADAIDFAGRLPNDAVFERLAAADVLVSTSVGEPYGRGIVEAMSVGTPAVCHRSGGPADVITDGTDGLLVETPDAQAYADAIHSAHQHGKLAAMGVAAADKAKAWRSGVVLDELERSLVTAVRGGGRTA